MNAGVKTRVNVDHEFTKIWKICWFGNPCAANEQDFATSMSQQKAFRYCSKLTSERDYAIFDLVAHRIAFSSLLMFEFTCRVTPHNLRQVFLNNILFEASPDRYRRPLAGVVKLFWMTLTRALSRRGISAS
ncbi:hypothetical protein CO660_12410 [Rhizobium sp. L9]|nr:hypothetical protein CO660_12410 [Rhizobium sp. L9]